MTEQHKPLFREDESEENLSPLEQFLKEAMNHAGLLTLKDRKLRSEFFDTRRFCIMIEDDDDGSVETLSGHIIGVSLRTEKNHEYRLMLFTSIPRFGSACRSELTYLEFRHRPHERVGGWRIHSGSDPIKAKVYRCTLKLS